MKAFFDAAYFTDVVGYSGFSVKFFPFLSYTNDWWGMLGCSLKWLVLGCAISLINFEYENSQLYFLPLLKNDLLPQTSCHLHDDLKYEPIKNSRLHYDFEHHYLN